MLYILITFRFFKYVKILTCANLYWDEDAVDDDPSEGCVTQDEAGIDNACYEEDRHACQKAPKQHCIKQLVAVIGQDVNHLDRRQMIIR